MLFPQVSVYTDTMLFSQVSVYTDTIISDSEIMISVQEIEINLHCTLAVENGNNFQKVLPN